MKESKAILIYDDYNSLIPRDQSVMGTVRATFGHTALRNGFKIIETNIIEAKDEQIITARAVGRERTEEEKRRRHLYGDKGAKFSSGKRMCILGSVSSCITTLPCKDNIIAEFYEY